MRSLKNDFSANNSSEGFYDIRDDWELIEASMLMQYGMRMRKEAIDMPFPEFITLLSGIMPETPLGSVVSIRAETDSKTIKNFNKDQKRIYNEWKRRKAKSQLEDSIKFDESMKELEASLAAMFGKGGG